MKIIIDARPAFQNQAGIGRYTKNLIESLAKIDQINEYFFLVGTTLGLSLQLGNNFHIHQIPQSGLFWHINAIRNPINTSFNLYYSPSSLLVPALANFPTGLMIHDLSAIKFPNFHSSKTKIIEKLLMQKALTKSKFIITPSL